MREIELKNVLKIDKKKFLVSTISMNVRHSWFEGDDDRKVYETMVFEIIDDDISYENPRFNERYSTMEEAIAEHGALLKNPKEFFIL